jgi:hypothetical protein
MSGLESGPWSIHRSKLYWAGRESSFVRWHGGIGGDGSELANNTMRRRRRKKAKQVLGARVVVSNRLVHERTGIFPAPLGATVLPFSLRSSLTVLANFLLSLAYSSTSLLYIWECECEYNTNIRECSNGVNHIVLSIREA